MRDDPRPGHHFGSPVSSVWIVPPFHSRYTTNPDVGKTMLVRNSLLLVAFSCFIYFLPSSVFSFRLSNVDAIHRAPDQHGVRPVGAHSPDYHQLQAGSHGAAVARVVVLLVGGVGRSHFHHPHGSARQADPVHVWEWLPLQPDAGLTDSVLLEGNKQRFEIVQEVHRARI